MSVEAIVVATAIAIAVIGEPVLVTMLIARVILRTRTDRGTRAIQREEIRTLEAAVVGDPGGDTGRP